MTRIGKIHGGLAMGLALAWAAPALAAEEGTTPAADTRGAVPVVGYAYNLSATTGPSVGAQAYGLGLAGPGKSLAGGGGGMAWGSLERLTLIADASRDLNGNLAPTGAILVRVLGAAGDGWSLGALGKVQRSGFGLEPAHTADSATEMEPEADVGAVLSFASLGWHLDLNAIGGVGLGDDSDVDAETRARFGRDIARWLRVGLDGEARFRLTGPKVLPGGRTWDFAGGPQLFAGSNHFFASLTTGPATMNLASGVGWTGIVSFGGTTL